MQAFMLRGQEIDLSNLFFIINTEKHQTRKKGQKRTKIAKTFEWLTWFDPLFLLWPYQTDISTFKSRINALSRPQRELEQNRQRDMSFDLGFFG
jgi:hypothetical protein